MAQLVTIVGGLNDPRLQWMFPPQHVSLDQGHLILDTLGGTDYWQRTHYGFQNHNGHFFHLPDVRGDFIMCTAVRPLPQHRFDQAGLMVMLSSSCWLKTSVEYGGPGRPSQLGVVVTNAGFSDWSTMDIPDNIGILALRVRREGSDYIVEACVPHGALPAGAVPPITTGSGAVGSSAAEWTQLRICHLLEDVSPAGVSKDGSQNVLFGEQLAGMADLLPLSGVKAGVYACSPKPGSGMRVCFECLHIEAGRIAGHQ